MTFPQVLSEVWRVSFLEGRSSGAPYAISVHTGGQTRAASLCAGSFPAGSRFPVRGERSCCAGLVCGHGPQRARCPRRVGLRRPEPLPEQSAARPCPVRAAASRAGPAPLRGWLPLPCGNFANALPYCSPAFPCVSRLKKSPGKARSS